MKPGPGREPAFGSERADAIVERDPLTRFSDPASVLVSRPGESVQDTTDRVLRELERMPARVG